MRDLPDSLSAVFAITVQPRHTAAALGNALADAIGVRVRRLPMTRERVTAVIEAG